jgi:hypothetical protein
LNEVESLSFDMPQTDSNSALVHEWTTEVRARVGSSIYFWGPVVRVQNDYRLMRVQCQGIFAYFRKRFLSYAGRSPQLLVNGYFENTTGQTFTNGVGSTNPFGWTPYLFTLQNGLQTQGGPWSRPVSTHKFGGSYGVRIENNTEGQDMWLGQTVTVTTGATDERYVLSGDLHICTDSVTGPLGPFTEASQGRGLCAFVRPQGASVTTPPTAEAVYFVGPMYGHQPGQSYSSGNQYNARPSRSFIVPKNGTWDIDVRLYAPRGSIVWDNVELRRDPVYSSNLGTDLREVILDILTLAQDTTLGKSSLNITATGVTFPLTGITRTASFAYGDRLQVLGVLQSFTNMRDGVDMWFTYGETSRYLNGTRQNVHADGRGRGSVLPAYAIELGTHIADYTVSGDGEQTANAITVISDPSPGNGILPTEGVYVDTSTLGGLVLEEVLTVDSGMSRDAVDALARRRWDVVSSTPQIITVRLVPGTGHELNVWPGDVIPVTIQRGNINLNAAYKRVVEKQVDPTSGVVTLTLN